MVAPSELGSERVSDEWERVSQILNGDAMPLDLLQGNAALSEIELIYDSIIAYAQLEFWPSAEPFVREIFQAHAHPVFFAEPHFAETAGANQTLS